jgi:Zn-dependent peptidase ImmA (M78 family)/transcriptional regulator with XRE-family HTH domain
MRPGTPGFVGARLRQGREARGLTASALAELIGVSRAAISQYEGKLSPSPEVMRRISSCLNLPIQWFLRPLPKRESGTIFFRCMSSATKGARLRAERKYEWLREISGFVAERVKLPPVKFPDLELPNDPTQLTSDFIEEAATQVRRFWGMQDGPISNVSWLLENNGAIVARFDLHAATLDAFSEWGKQDWRPYMVLGSHKNSACRSRFDAAHELAHLVLHRNVPKSAYTQNAAFGLMESQAHQFAGAFLLPATTLANEFVSPSLDYLLSVKQRWRVSLAAIIARLGQVGLVNEEQERRLWINLGRRKWRTSEPLDDTIECEQPRLLRRCLELIVSKGLVSPGELPFQVGLPEKDIEGLVGLPEGYFQAADRPLEIVGHHDNDRNDRMIIRLPQAN